ncbi:VOC family protein [Halobellus limi]|jgi:catechol 2,3-dioxygenase|uniref:Catechol 2,3-dioxygenase n=1 Tax=Halobellus limi TaxID=699433 RepID=A0A1H6A0L3_9EURY|nr:VOC family protein [Halobellus limi]QCC47867.1 lactoylglutathione lyase [Halobellus limi]SEG41960.1 catechol 2,3-dioxygenase [Halobellus limi]
MAELAKLGHIAFETPDLEESLWFFRDLMGMKVVERDDDTAYLCALRDYEHHTMSLTEGERGAVDHIGFRAKNPESVEEYYDRFEELGRDVWWTEDGHEAGIGDSIMFESESGHRFEIYYEMEKPDIDGEQRSNIPMRRYSPEYANRVYPQRIDHTHVQDGNPEATSRLFEEEFGMGLNEVFKSEDGTTWGWWHATTPLPHDIAVHRLEEDATEFHHIAYHLDHLQDLWDAADILSENNVEIDGGPGKHAITNANYLYVNDPASGIRLELFAGPGYLNFEPDWETVVWQEDIGSESDHQWFGTQYSLGGIPYTDR